MSRADMDALLDDGIKTAIHFLEKRGEFFPFAVIRTDRGEIVHVETLLDNVQPSSDDVLTSIKSSLRRAAVSGTCVSAAIISNIRLTDTNAGTQSDAIKAEIDDAEGEPIACFVPYEVVSGEIRVGEIKAGAGSRIAF